MQFFAKAGQFLDMQSKNSVTRKALEDAEARREHLSSNARDADIRYQEAKKAYDKVQQVRRPCAHPCGDGPQSQR